MKRKSIVVSRIIHIGKENNDLEKVQTFGLDSNSYVTYEDQNGLDGKFKELSHRILQLSPKDVKKFGISKQTLWNIKQKINLEQTKQITNKIKQRLIFCLEHLYA